MNNKNDKITLLKSTFQINFKYLDFEKKTLKE